MVHPKRSRNSAQDSAEDGDPVRVRAAIMSEHADIRRLLRRVEHSARRLATASPPHEPERAATYEAASLLCKVVAAHIELENRVLAPALEKLDAWGKVRADRLRAEHADQVLVLRSYVAALDHLSASEPEGTVLAEVARQLVETLRKDMDIEEETLLRVELWRDDPTSHEVESG